MPFMDCSLFFKDEPQNCCMNGQLCPLLYSKLLRFENVSPLFRELFNQNHKYSEAFIKDIHILNSIFSFTSLGISSHLT